MLHFEEEEMFWFRAIREGKHISTVLMYEGILILDKPYMHDIYLEQGFRHEKWMQSKIWRQDDSSSATRQRSDIGDEFLRKKVREVLTKKQKMMQDNLKSRPSQIYLWTM